MKNLFRHVRLAPTGLMAQATPSMRDLTPEMPLDNWPGHDGAAAAQFKLHRKIDQCYKLNEGPLSSAL